MEGNVKSASVKPHMLISPWHLKLAVEGSRSSHLDSEGKWCLRLAIQFLPPILDYLAHYVTGSVEETPKNTFQIIETLTSPHP